jgi:hypothetical protein
MLLILCTCKSGPLYPLSRLYIPSWGYMYPSSLLMFLLVLCQSVWSLRLYICAEYVQYPTRRFAYVLCILPLCECCQGVWCHNPEDKTWIFTMSVKLLVYMQPSRYSLWWQGGSFLWHSAGAFLVWDALEQCFSTSFSFCTSITNKTFMCMCLWINQSVCQSISLSICQSISLSICQFTYCLSIIYLSLPLKLVTVNRRI